MAAIQAPTATYDDGLYHPATPTAASPPSTAIPTASAVTSLASLSPILLIPSSVVQPNSDSITTSQSLKTGFTGSGSSYATSTLPSTTSSAKTSQIAQPDSPRNSTPLVLGVFVFLLLFLGLVLFLGYLNRQNFRNWRDRRRERKKQTLVGLPYRRQEFDGMLEIGWPQERQGFDEKDASFEPDDARKLYTPSDPFARSIPRRSQIQSYFASRNHSNTEVIEHIDDERGWLWGTRRSKNSRVTPGLGTGRYRAKSNTSRANNSRERLDDDLLTPSEYSASTYSETDSHLQEVKHRFKPESEELDKELNEYLAESRTTVTSKEYSEQMQESRNHGSFTASSAAYILERLKDSITKRSGPNNLRSSRGRARKDSVRGQWNEIGQFENDENDESENERTVMLDCNPTPKTKSCRTRRRELSLADIPLPDVPLLAWDATSSPMKQRFSNHSNHSTDEDSTSKSTSTDGSPVRRTTRGWTLSDQARPPISFTAALPSSSATSQTKTGPPRSRVEDRAAIRNSLSTSTRQVLSPELQPDLFFTAPSPPHHKMVKSNTESGMMNALLGSSDQIYSLTGIAQLIFPSGAADGGGADNSSKKMMKSQSASQHTESYTSLPPPRSGRRKQRSDSISQISTTSKAISPPPKRRPAIKHRVPSREFETEDLMTGDRAVDVDLGSSPVRKVHPGGFVGRTPTKKLKKKTVIGTSARTHLQLRREHNRAFDTVDAIVRSGTRNDKI